MTKKDLEPRVERLENDVAGMRQDVAVARVLASGADRDVSELRSEFRAQRRVLNALRATQVEHGRRLDSLERTVSDGFGTLNVGMAQIVTLLQRDRE